MKLGRRPPVFTPNNLRAQYRMRASLDALGAPPASSADFVSAVRKRTGGNWRMMLNDSLGDCVCADTGHALMLRTANMGTMVTPTAYDILKLYEAVGGYVPGNPSTDQGCDEGQMCAYMQTTGLLGHKSSGTAPVVAGTCDAAALDRIRWATQLYGSCRLGVNLPQSAMDQFNAGQNWSVVPGSPIIGGHDVPVVMYSPTEFWVVTWGRRVSATPEWLMAYVEEAHAEVFPDFISAQGLSPDGFNLAQLIADLQDLKAG